MRIGKALQELHRSESALAVEFSRVAERYPREREVRHVAGDLAVWSRDHVREIVATAPRYRVDLSGPEYPVPFEKETRELPDEDSDPELALLADLRRLYRMSGGVALDWDLLGQGAQAVADADLLAIADRCGPRSARQMRWARGMLKILSPQILAT